MRILFYHSSAFNKAPFGELLDEAEMFFREGHDVYFATCAGVMNACCSNPVSNRADCKVCKWSCKHSLKLLSPGIHSILLDEHFTAPERTWNYTSAQEIKQIKYRGVEIGYAVLSLYISETRNLNPKIDARSKPFFDNFLTQSANLTDALENVINEIKPDRICLFNGRLFDAKPALELALQKNIDAWVYELIRSGKKDPHKKYCKVVFRNHLPHDLPYLKELMDRAWENSSKPLDERIAIGKSFFEKRRNGIAAGDKVYTAHQQKGLLPADWDPEKRNIAIFNSSEDEFAAIGDKMEKYAIFPSQLEGVKAILSLFKDNTDIHFYLRVHPNLIPIPYKYHKDLYRLSEMFPNITVIPAAENISTYDLMDASEKVIVFGSTMGIESAYWNKAVILLAGTSYYHYDICYKPSTPDELKQLILDPHLPPRYNLETCCKFGFYFLDCERADYPNSYHHIDYNNFSVSMGKRTFYGTFCQKLLGSSRLYAYYVAARRLLAEKLCRKKHKIPLEEA